MKFDCRLARIALRVFAPAAFLLATCGHVSAQTPECYTDSIPLQSTNWNHSATFPAFDDTDRMLTSIEVSLHVHVEGSAAIESGDAAPVAITTNYSAIVQVQRPDGTALINLTPSTSFYDLLGPFDGIFDFGGTSGVTHSGIVLNENQTITSPPTILDFADFTSVGTVSLPVVTVGNSTATGSGGFMTLFLTEVSAQVEICYSWDRDCNGNGVPDGVDLSSGSSADLNGNWIPDECDAVPFCEGWSACPCGNQSAPGSAEGCLNGTGLGAVLASGGAASVGADSLVLTVSQASPNQVGAFVQNLSTGSAAPFYDGLLCLPGDSHLVRHYAPPVILPTLTDALGTGSTVQPLTAGDFLGDTQPGVTLYYQFWYRDPLGPCGTGANFSSGLAVMWWS